MRDTSYGMVRVEEVCGRCGSHLGRAFSGRPVANRQTSLLQFRLYIEEGNTLPDVLGRGPQEGLVLA
jgi:peptide-methionine (R)-S-oxide reductase